MNKFLTHCTLAAALAAIPALLSTVAAHDGASHEDPRIGIAKARVATARFRDLMVAQQAGYAQFLDCVDEHGQGGMGVHYLNGALVGDPAVDALKPEALVYAPAADGKLQLVALEYIVFQDAWDAVNTQPPALFGHPFHLVRAPNRYGVPAFYELHLWAWKPNRNGMFNDWNPAVRCP